MAATRFLAPLPPSPPAFLHLAPRTVLLASKPNGVLSALSDRPKVSSCEAGTCMPRSYAPAPLPI
ncbi:hypothetical protein K523DRAFT_326257 [Schizophyllum commune Tattone D]|nr:hypothetical protein K523DRAFT_326257 [Schizophyllum commune Tattone D]